MKIINTIETLQVAGGLSHGVIYPRIDNNNIPSSCVALFEAFAIDIVRAAGRLDVSSSQLSAVMGAHFDAIKSTGCDAYADLYIARIKAVHTRLV